MYSQPKAAVSKDAIIAFTVGAGDVKMVGFTITSTADSAQATVLVASKEFAQNGTASLIVKAVKMIKAV